MAHQERYRPPYRFRPRKDTSYMGRDEVSWAPTETRFLAPQGTLSGAVVLKDVRDRGTWDQPGYPLALLPSPPEYLPETVDPEYN